MKQRRFYSRRLRTIQDIVEVFFILLFLFGIFTGIVYLTKDLLKL